MHIAFYGPNNFLDDAFIAGSAPGLEDLVVLSATPTQIVLRNAASNITSILVGTDLAPDPVEGLSVIAGTVTGWTTLEGSEPTLPPVLQVTGLTWPAQDFFDAVFAIRTHEDEEPLLALLNLQPVTIDASTADAPIHEMRLHGVTQPVTFVGSAFGDFLSGGDGNDVIDLGGVSAGEGDLLFGSLGSDRIIFNPVVPFQGRAELVYAHMHELAGGDVPITVTINGAANTGTISGAWGTDTLAELARALNPQSSGLTVVGTRQNDVFLVDGGPNSWMQIDGGAGRDSYNITLTGTVRLSFRGHWSDAQKPSQGVQVNLASSQIFNDGHGHAETLNLTAGPGMLELQGSDHGDRIVGSLGDDRFIVSGGNDTIDGGTGHDALRYDRAQLARGVQIDVGAGTVDGVWSFEAGGTQSFRDQISRIEEFRGSSHSDTMTAVGTSAGVIFEGRSGDDVLIGGGGDDKLYGGAGNDHLRPGNNTGRDVIDPGLGHDLVDFNGTTGGRFVLEHRDLPAGRGLQVVIDRVGDGAGGRRDDVVEKGDLGRTTLLSTGNALQAEGFVLRGTAAADVFDIALVGGDLLEIQAGQGVDRYELSGTGGRVRLNFERDEEGAGAPNNLSINLAGGIVENDGFGNREEILLSGGVGVEILGTRHADAMIGSDGDDMFHGLGGNDGVHGGAGRDMLRYDRAGPGDWVMVDLGRNTARGTFEGSAYTQTISGIEDIHGTQGADVLIGTAGANRLVSGGGQDWLFGDGVKPSAFMDQATQVYRLYQATLGRAPDIAGHEHWTQQLVLGQIDAKSLPMSFTESPEFRALYGGKPLPEVIGLLYDNVLGRSASAAEVEAWMKVSTDLNVIVTGLSDSQEFIQKIQADAVNFAATSDAAYWGDSVYRLYQATLARTPDMPGLRGWSTELAQGKTLTEVAKGFVDSPEFQYAYGGASDYYFVDLLYWNVLQRSSDEAGFNGWLEAMSKGMTREEVVIGFSQSPEFIAATQQGFKEWVRDQGVDDVLMVSGGTGDVLLHGGMLADVFVFDVSAKGNHVVRDLEAWDQISFESFGYANLAALRGKMTQSGDSFSFSDQDVSITFHGTQLSSLTDDMLLI